MLYWALVFAVIALVAGVFGFGGVASLLLSAWAMHHPIIRNTRELPQPVSAH